MEKHIIFGISPFNTKFSKEYIFNMLDWGFLNFNYVDILHSYRRSNHTSIRWHLYPWNNILSTKKENNKWIKKSVSLIKRWE